MTNFAQTDNKEGTLVKKLFTLAVLTVALLALMAAPALAEGYNDGGYNWTTKSTTNPYGIGAGIYVRTQSGADQIATSKGPHGDYSVSTNKCQDCHSTHYATGSYMLLRANSREDACTHCHAGGGGSATNIQMDNEYDANGVLTNADPNWTGFGTGHTLGYKGNAPADIQPAYSDAKGFACFNCHSPHGNSARIMTTMANPGHAIDQYPGAVGTNDLDTSKAGIVTMVFTTDGMSATVAPVQSSQVIKNATYISTGPLAGYYDLSHIGTSYTDLPVSKQGQYWGMSPVSQNMAFVGWATDATTGVKSYAKLFARPIFPSGKWLLLKNPHNELNTTGATITVYDWARTSFAAGDASPGVTPAQSNRGAVKVIGPGQPIPDTVVQFKFTGSNGVTVAVDAPARAGSTNFYRVPSKVYIKGTATLNGDNTLTLASGAEWSDTHAAGVNKLVEDWVNPMGPADNSYGPDQDAERLYRPSNQTGGGWPGFLPRTANGRGFGSMSGFCQDCHDGATGASTQKALVAKPDESATFYITAYAHDMQPRH